MDTVVGYSSGGCSSVEYKLGGYHQSRFKRFLVLLLECFKEN